MNQSIGSFSINPFRNGIVVERKPEAVEHIEVTIDEAVERTMLQYDSLKNIECEIILKEQKLLNVKMEVLTPAQIQLVLIKMINPDNYTIESYLSISAYSLNNMFISELIQASYDHGNNNFILYTKDIQFNLLGLKGVKNNPLYATIIGNPGRCFGHKSDACIFDLHGEIDEYCGSSSKNSVYNIQGNAGEWLGCTSKDCTYNVLGNVGICCGDDSKDSNYNINGNAERFFGDKSEKCTYNIKGKIKEWISQDVKNSTFKISNEENYDLLVQKLPSSNTIQLLDGAGRIIIETRK